MDEIREATRLPTLCETPRRSVAAVVLLRADQEGRRRLVDATGEDGVGEDEEGRQHHQDDHGGEAVREPGGDSPPASIADGTGELLDPRELRGRLVASPSPGGAA